MIPRARKSQQNNTDSKEKLKLQNLRFGVISYTNDKSKRDDYTKKNFCV